MVTDLKTSDRRSSNCAVAECRWCVPAIALLLGIASVIAALVICFVTYQHTLDYTEQRYQQFYLEMARILAEDSNSHMDRSEDSALSNISKIWERYKEKPADAYVCVVDRDSNLILHTSHPNTVGNYAGGNKVLGNKDFLPCSLSELSKQKEDYVGGYISSSGQSQIAAFISVPNRGWTIGVHRSREALLDEVRLGLRPLFTGMIVVCGILIPVSMFLLFWTFNIARQKRKQAEEALAESEKKNRTWLESSPVCTKMVDLDFNLQYMSAAGVNGLGIDDISQYYGKPYPIEFYPESFRETMMDKLQRVKDTGEIITHEGFLLALDGNELWFHSTIVPVNDDDGRIEYLIVVSMDITDRKKLEAEREELLKTLSSKNNELQSIVYTTSHDLKSPLVNINGFSKALERSCEKLSDIIKDIDLSKKTMKPILSLLEEDIPESLEFISAGEGKMMSLLDGLLHVSRVGSAELNIESLDMNPIIKKVCEAMEFQVKDAGVEIELDDLPGCCADGNMINQLFSNLVGNSLKYLDPKRKGKIHISGEVEGGRSVYCVEDNGMGIEANHQPKVFELFHRLHPDDEVGGEGLGLTIVTRILERNDGSIWLESEAGKGTKFFVSLPTAASPVKI